MLRVPVIFKEWVPEGSIFFLWLGITPRGSGCNCRTVDTEQSCSPCKYPLHGEHTEQNMNGWSLSAVALHAPAKHLHLQSLHVAFAEHSREISFA